MSTSTASTTADPADFWWLDRLIHRDELVVRIELVTALRVGRGKSAAAADTDLPIVRDGAGVPVVPGASIKGVLRSSVEALVRGLAAGHGADERQMRRIACDVLDDRQGCLARIPDDSDDRDVGRRVQKRQAYIADCACLVCATYGGPSLASHLRVPDAPLDGAATQIRDGVGIDRDLGRVSGARKYDFEVVDAGCAFTLNLVVDNARDWQLGLVYAGLDALDGGGRLGGFGSRGLGAVRVVGLDTLCSTRRTALELVRRDSGCPGPDPRVCVDALLAKVAERATAPREEG